jgi:hypothetical protein
VVALQAVFVEMKKGGKKFADPMTDAQRKISR